jgi:tetratricopeptide (TPR) repeat protein
MNSSSVSVAAAEHPEKAEVSHSSGSFWSRHQQALLCVLLVVAVLACYSSVTRNGFLNYDDDHYITTNQHVRAGLTWNTVKWAFTTYDQANWHPLTWLSHALDSQLFGQNPAGHHLVNVLLHATNAVILFLLLQAATGFRWRSLMVAALFALHPLNVESVAWAAERKSVLSMMFFLLALYAYGWYAQRPGVRRYAMVACLFAAALLAKPQVITFPFLLLLWDYWPLRRLAISEPGSATQAGSPNTSLAGGLLLGKLVQEKLPLLLLSALSAVVTMKAQTAGGAVQTLSLYSLPLRLETALISYVAYLGKALWPSKLAALYPHPTALYPAWQVGAASVLLLLITALVLQARRERPYLAIGWFWFLGSMVPMIGLVQAGAHAMTDRHTYLPFIGLFLMLTWLAADWASARQLSATSIAIAAVSCLLVFGSLTYRQVGFWHDIPSFWAHTLAVTENNYVAHDALGEFLASQGRTEEAAAQSRAALAIWPDDLPAELNLGIYEHARGNLVGAIERYQIVVLHSADVGTRATAYGNLGSAYRQMGEWGKAKLCYEAALKLTPDRAMAMIGLGLIAQKNGDAAEAVQQYSHAMTVEPTDVGFLLLAGALKQQGHSDEAKALSDRVARFSPDLVAARSAAEALRAGK